MAISQRSITPVLSQPAIESNPAAIINALLDHPPAGIGFTADEIREIIRAQNLFGHLETIDRGSYLDEFLASFG